MKARSPLMRDAVIVFIMLFTTAIYSGLAAEPWSADNTTVLEKNAGPVAHGVENWYPHRLVRSTPARFDGPFRVAGATFYFVHFGGPLKVTVTVKHDIQNPSKYSRVAVFNRFYNADGEILQRNYYKFDDAGGAEKTFDFQATSGNAGIYQLRCSVTHARKMSIDVQTRPKTSFGILPCRSRMYAPAKEQFKNAYIYIPARAQKFAWKLYAGTAKLYDDEGNLILEGERVDTSEIELTERDVVYRLDVRHWRDRSKFGTGGFPAILCPDEQTARNIRASLEFAPDGTMLYHKSQLRLWRWMHNLSADEMAVEPVPLSKHRKLWLQDPTNIGLLARPGPLKHVPFILEQQNIDPDSDDYGKGVNASYLGAAYAVDEPANPYHGNEAILKRLLLYEFATFLDLNENGTFYLPDWDSYAGHDGLGYVAQPFLFGYLGQDAAGERGKDWLQAVSMPLNRFAFTRVSCENQTSHFLPGLYDMYKGSDLQIYEQLAHDFAVGLCKPQYNKFMKTGYQQEKYGPDSTYQGLGACNQAIYYQFAEDPVVKQGLDRIYNLFNLTVAPQPDGAVYGASNFCHRTSGSWADRQWRGGTKLMADTVKSAAAWHQDMRPFSSVADDWKHQIDRVLDSEWNSDFYEKNLRWVNRYPFMPWTTFFDGYMFPPKDIPEAALPVETDDQFTRNANDEFYFLRRPDYFASVYVGHTSHEWMKPKRKEVPFHSGWKKDGELLKAESRSARKNAWYPTQGLCMFWTPEYGNCILGKNWNVYTAQMVRADLADGRCSWPDYWSINHRWNPTENAITIDQKMIELPIHINRSITFEDDGIQQSVKLSIEKKVQVNRLVEQIPYLNRPDQKLLFFDGDNWTDSEPDTCRGVWVGGDDGNGVAFRFDNSVNVSTGLSSHSRGHQVNLLQVNLGSQFAAGDTVKVGYRVSPAKRKELR